jgi:excisionase family DNA binding protein
MFPSLTRSQQATKWRHLANRNQAKVRKREAQGRHSEVNQSRPQLVYDLWPEVGEMLGLTRNATYQAAKRGEIPTIRFGKLLKVPRAALDKMMEQAGAR